MPPTSHHINHHVSPHGRYDGSAVSDGFRFVEVMSGARRRRDWSDDEKLSVIAESYSGRTSVSAVARRYGINKNQLFQWRRQFRDGAFEPIAESVEFVPVVSGAGARDQAGSEIAPPFHGAIADVACSAMIEIAIGAATVRVPPRADEATVRLVLTLVASLR